MSYQFAVVFFPPPSSSQWVSMWWSLMYLFTKSGFLLGDSYWWVSNYELMVYYVKIHFELKKIFCFSRCCLYWYTCHVQVLLLVCGCNKGDLSMFIFKCIQRHELWSDNCVKYSNTLLKILLEWHTWYSIKVRFFFCMVIAGCLLMVVGGVRRHLDQTGCQQFNCRVKGFGR